ncbi:hypothetical protein ACLOJK_004212, partial [Asimina triloba]
MDDSDDDNDSDDDELQNSSSQRWVSAWSRLLRGRGTAVDFFKVETRVRLPPISQPA